MNLPLIDQADLKNKSVVARFDFNVPLTFSEDQEQNLATITDTTRIDLALPTIKYLLEQDITHLVLMSHLGRPKGKPQKKMSLRPVAEYLAQALGQEVLLTESAVDCNLKSLLKLKQNKIILLENLRFHKEETDNNHEFAMELASYGDVYVNDAFGTLHRKHASTFEINAFFSRKDSLAGFLVQKEVLALKKITDYPEKPFVAILGGSKIADKIKTIETLLSSVDHLLIGGAMAYPFLSAQGKHVGRSLCDEEDIKLAKHLLNDPRAIKLHFPMDHVVAKDINADQGSVTSDVHIEKDWMGLDIGPQTADSYKSIIQKAKMVFWNGPMGLFEKQAFSQGTFKIAQILAEVDAFTLIGGGDSVSAVKKSGYAEKMSHLCTGGGASLEFIEKGDLPGLKALKYGIN